MTTNNVAEESLLLLFLLLHPFAAALFSGTGRVWWRAEFNEDFLRRPFSALIDGNAAVPTPDHRAEDVALFDDRRCRPAKRPLAARWRAAFFLSLSKKNRDFALHPFITLIRRWNDYLSRSKKRALLKYKSTVPMSREMPFIQSISLMENWRNCYRFFIPQLDSCGQETVKKWKSKSGFCNQLYTHSKSWKFLTLDGDVPIERHFSYLQFKQWREALREDRVLREDVVALESEIGGNPSGQKDVDGDGSIGQRDFSLTSLFPWIALKSQQQTTNPRSLRTVGAPWIWNAAFLIRIPSHIMNRPWKRKWELMNIQIGVKICIRPEYGWGSFEIRHRSSGFANGLIGSMISQTRRHTHALAKRQKQKSERRRATTQSHWRFPSLHIHVEREKRDRRSDEPFPSIVSFRA